MSVPKKLTANKSDVIAYFGGVVATAKAYGITKGAVSQWPELIPENRARQLPEITGNELLPFQKPSDSKAA